MIPDNRARVSYKNHTTPMRFALNPHRGCIFFFPFAVKAVKKAVTGKVTAEIFFIEFGNLRTPEIYLLEIYCITDKKEKQEKKRFFVILRKNTVIFAVEISSKSK